MITRLNNKYAKTYFCDVCDREFRAGDIYCSISGIEAKKTNGTRIEANFICNECFNLRLITKLTPKR